MCPTIGAKTLSLKWSNILYDGALHREATGEAKRERHGSLAGRRIVGGSLIRCKDESGIGGIYCGCVSKPHKLDQVFTT
jgi:hypothetical protein